MLRDVLTALLALVVYAATWCTLGYHQGHAAAMHEARQHAGNRVAGR